jgi:PAS domain S-box-containing protein
MENIDTVGNVQQYARQLEAIVESSTDALLVKDLDGRYQFANEAAAEFLGCEKTDVLGATDEELFGEEHAREIRRQERRVLETETTETFEETLPVADGERVFETTRAPYYDPDDDLAGTICISRDVTDQKVRERTLEDQRDELATLDRINEVVQEVIRTLIGEPTHEEIARAVCDRLAESELYKNAWIGEPDPSGSKITEVRGAGLDEEMREVIETLDMGEESEEPVAEAYHTRETRVVKSIRGETAFRQARRERLLERGVRSGIAVPIRYGDTTYGVLAVESDRLSAFSEREADAFDVLGVIIGFAIGAVKHRRLALSDTVVELEFRLTDSDAFYVSASEELDCSLRLEGMAAGPEGTLLFYDAVRGADPDEVLDFSADWDAVEDVRLVSERDEESLFEFTMSGSSVVVTLSEYGAKTREAFTEDGEAHVVAELPADANVRSVVERVQTKFPDVEFVAKRETERDLQTSREFRQDLNERLTDAQRTALRASYFAGYYEWPRDSTAEEVAASLDVSSPTFHQHIRKGLRELLGTFFDVEGDRP